jgi:isopentenyl-diphosphate delta-isomerase
MHDETHARKQDHIRINVEGTPLSTLTNGFERYRFLHNALPECALDDIDLRTTAFGRPLDAPILISCMTGGTDEAHRLNGILADAAERFGFAMGLGSARLLLQKPDLEPYFGLRERLRTRPLLANIGAVQLNYDVTPADCARLVDTLQADALVVHLNSLQEAVQPAGQTNFRNLIKKIGRLCDASRVPVVVKEVGWGIAVREVEALRAVGVSAVDLAGAGGTSWSEVERMRQPDAHVQRVAAHFTDWGIPTACALADLRAIDRETFVIASGGIAHGVDAAKALALGANLVGIAGPFIRAAAKSPGALTDYARELVDTLRIAMFGIGAVTLDDVRYTERLQPA